MYDRDLEGLPEELIRAQQFIFDAKVDEATRLIESFQKRENLSSREIASCHYLQAEMLSYQGRYQEAFNRFDLVFKEAIETEELLAISALIQKSFILSWMQRIDEAFSFIQKLEELMSSVKRKDTKDYKLREAKLVFLKGAINIQQDPDKAIVLLERSLKLRKETGIKEDIAQSYFWLASVLALRKGELELAIEHVNSGLSLLRDIKKKNAIYGGKFFAAMIFNLKGELDLSIEYYEEILGIVKEYGNNHWLSLVLNNMSGAYRMKGRIDDALGCIKQAIDLSKEMGIKEAEATCHDFYIKYLIQAGDLEQAKKALIRFESLSQELNDDVIKLEYLFCRALILKTSSRTINRGKAEEILKNLLEEKNLSHEMESGVLITLSDILLNELRVTDDPEVLSELESYITQLLEVAEKSHSFIVLGESYLLRAKLALLTLNLPEARRFLTRGQRITEKYGLTNLAVKISNEHDDLLKKLEEWGRLKEEQSSISDRLDLARIGDQVELMTTKRIPEPEPTSDEDPVVILIMSEGGNPIFSQSFSEEWRFEEHLFGGFLTAVNSFSDEMFSEELDRANFGEYTLLMKSTPPFVICYLFKGQSYNAQKRLKCFIKQIQEKAVVWEVFNRCRESNRHCQIREVPSLENVITELFIEKTIP